MSSVRSLHQSLHYCEGGNWTYKPRGIELLQVFFNGPGNALETKTVLQTFLPTGLQPAHSSDAAVLLARL